MRGENVGMYILMHLALFQAGDLTLVPYLSIRRRLNRWLLGGRLDTRRTEGLLTINGLITAPMPPTHALVPHTKYQSLTPGGATKALHRVGCKSNFPFASTV